jgi:hypothetical protein
VWFASFESTDGDKDMGIFGGTGANGQPRRGGGIHWWVLILFAGYAA